MCLQHEREAKVMKNSFGIWVIKKVFVYACKHTHTHIYITQPGFDFQANTRALCLIVVFIVENIFLLIYDDAKASSLDKAMIPL